MTTLHRPALDRALTVTHEGPGRATAVLDPTWASWAGPHGGLVAALLVQAAAPLAGERSLRALSAQFLTAAPLGEVVITAGCCVRAARRASSVSSCSGPSATRRSPPWSPAVGRARPVRRTTWWWPPSSPGPRA